MNPKCLQVLEAILLSMSEGGHDTPVERPDIVERVFDLMKDELLDYIVKEEILGEVLAHCHSVEWQKRGLPECYS